MRAKTYRITLQIEFRETTDFKDLNDLIDWFKYEYNENHNGSIKNPIQDMHLTGVESKDPI